VVEDDDAIAGPLVAGLVAEHFEVQRVGTAAEALAAPPVDLVLLDLGLPDGEGREVITALRNVTPVPIIVVTARGEETERVTGLNLGADDYVVKPFGFQELVARIWAVARRGGSRTPGPPSLQRLGALEIDRRARGISVDGAHVACTPKEYAILELLAYDPGSLVTRQDLLDKVWGTNWYGTTKMIDVHVASLRKKLGRPELIETVRGVGYRLAGDGAAGR
jgi:DNA-binding response OmpR family regulator